MEQPATEQKPTREELRQRLRNKQYEGRLRRMPRKIAEEKVEKMQKKAEEEREKMMEQIKAQLTPEQLQQMGIKPGDDFKIQIADDTNSSVEPGMVTDKLSLPKMTRQQKSQVNDIPDQNLEI